MSATKDMEKIRQALQYAQESVGQFTHNRVETILKEGGDPVTAADIELNSILREVLVEPGDGWLSEESIDDLGRLHKNRIWIVDPLDETWEFIEGINQWCISVALVENEHVVAGGICNPITNQLFLGSMQTGVTLKVK